MREREREERERDELKKEELQGKMPASLYFFAGLLNLLSSTM